MPLQKIATTTDIPVGSSQYVEITDDHAILIANVDGSLHAVYGKCSHYNLPLKDAAICEHRVRCPFHHACFDLRDGQQLETPGLGGLQTYDLKVEGDDIYVDLPEEWKDVHPRHLANPTENKAHFLIVGGGIAAINAIIGIRETESDAQITLVSADQFLPYDRTALSKSFLQGEGSIDDVLLLPRDWYDSMEIMLKFGVRVEELNTSEKTARMDDDTLLHFDKALIATGGKARQLPVEGADLDNVFTVRSFTESKALRAAAQKAQKVVVIGAGFIGLEIAMSLGKLGCQVTIVAPETTLFEKQWGERVGRYVQQLHEEKGVLFQLGHGVAAIQGNDGRVTEVALENGQRLKADLVVVGIGVSPNTDFVKGAKKLEDGSLKADNHLSVATDVFAAGDIVNYPDPRYGDVRIEHWKVAAQQGKVAGKNMAGTGTSYDMLPFFWSNQQGKNFRYAGHASEWDEIKFDGKPEDGAFIARYYRGEKLLAVLGLGHDQEVAQIAEAELK